MSLLGRRIAGPPCRSRETLQSRCGSTGLDHRHGRHAHQPPSLIKEARAARPDHGRNKIPPSTLQNADFAKPLFDKAGVRRAVLVTSSFHARRALTTPATDSGVNFGVATRASVGGTPSGRLQEDEWAAIEMVKIPGYWFVHGIQPWIKNCPACGNQPGLRRAECRRFFSSTGFIHSAKGATGDMLQEWPRRLPREAGRSPSSPTEEPGEPRETPPAAVFESSAPAGAFAPQCPPARGELCLQRIPG